MFTNCCHMGVQNVGLELQYKTCYARVLDSKRKFLQAATQYYELSQIENVQSGSGQVDNSSLHVPHRQAGRDTPLLCLNLVANLTKGVGLSTGYGTFTTNCFAY